MSPPQSADGQTSHACRLARTGQPAASQAKATGPEHSHEARHAAPARLGVASAVALLLAAIAGALLIAAAGTARTTQLRRIMRPDRRKHKQAEQPR